MGWVCLRKGKWFSMVEMLGVWKGGGNNYEGRLGLDRGKVLMLG